MGSGAKRIAILGSTGSVGSQTLQVAKHLGLQVVGLVAGSNRQLLEQQVALFQPEWAVLTNADAPTEMRGGTRFCFGLDALAEMSLHHGADLVVAAISGVAGLLPTWNAVESGATVALANKESLVTAGHILMPAAKAHGHALLPLDSEHSALWQCLEGRDKATVQRLILTASGGPFREWPAERLASATCQEALAHPTWNMGGKVTIDSATLMNKGLEVIEAHWLFDIGYDQIDVVVHPESIVHSLVEFTDGSHLAQLSSPDMRLPIQVALSYPERLVAPWPRLDLTQVGQLTFQRPRMDAFPCLALAISAGRAGKSYPIALNAANEVAVKAFQSGRLSFSGIARLVAAMLDQHSPEVVDSVSHVLQLSRRLEAEALDLLAELS